uniref:Uncharacterized protein n=1 Tax=Rhizophora mucronata TaxID=61149 RepID=A0A2P2J9C3_RHIMU
MISNCKGVCLKSYPSGTTARFWNHLQVIWPRSLLS